MSFITAYALLVTNAACLFVKIGFLVWAYMRTRQLAAIIYGLYILMGVAVPIVVFPQVDPDSDFFYRYQIATAVIETTLFVWLVRSLIKRPARSLPHDV
ncbi:MAG: hypothetical protein WBB01_22035 [Phormidesmis sp.]